MTIARLIEIHDFLIGEGIRKAVEKHDAAAEKTLAMFHVEFKRKVKEEMKREAKAETPRQTHEDDHGLF